MAIPNTPTLTVTDNADGTGAVATISGSTAGSTNTVYAQLVDGQIGSGTWTSYGSRSGDGTVSLALAVGFWWILVQSVKSGSQATSNVVYIYVSSGTAAIHERIMQAIQARIQGLTLTDVTSGNVIIRKVTTEQDVGTGKTYTYPCIQISPDGQERINANQGTNERDDITYPTMVAVMELDNLQNQSTNRARNLLWRERIVRAFRNQRLSGIPEVYTITITAQPIIQTGNWLEHKIYTSFFTINATARQVRGLV